MYTTGSIDRHYVVLAHMPGMGKGGAASVAATLQCSFRRIKLALVVRICGEVPIRTDGEEILLGDVIISTGIVQYDFGRQLQDRFIRKDTLEDYLRQTQHRNPGFPVEVGWVQGSQTLKRQYFWFPSSLAVGCSCGLASLPNLYFCRRAVCTSCCVAVWAFANQDIDPRRAA